MSQIPLDSLTSNDTMQSCYRYVPLDLEWGAEVFVFKGVANLFFQRCGYNAFLLRRPQRVFRVKGLGFSVVVVCLSS